MPLKSGEGRYLAPTAVLDELEGEGRVVFRYSGDNPNGSLRDIAGIARPTAASSGSCRIPSTPPIR